MMKKKLNRQWLMRSMFLVFSVMFLFTSGAHANNVLISWTPSNIKQSVGIGEQKSVDVTLVSNGMLTNVDLWIVPELQKYMSISPTHYETIEANIPYKLSIYFSIGPNELPGKYSGTIHAKIGSSTYPNVLKVDLNITGNENHIPVAIAGSDQSVFVADTVTLDGSQSSDNDSDPLTFAWSFVALPQGSKAILVNPLSVNPYFVVDLFGTYSIQLVVNDGIANSQADLVTISTENSRPVANAGPDQTAYVNSTVTLDGSGSTDIDGDPLTYEWALKIQPPNSTTTLTDPDTVHPFFFVDEPGNYEIELVVDDGLTQSKSDIVIVSTVNSAPVAHVGEAQNVFVGQTVTLDGSQSSDVDGDPLTYLWSFTVVPDGSEVTLLDPTSETPSFVPDLGGHYILQLIVNDGLDGSTPATVSVTATVSECLPGVVESCYSGPAGTDGVGICQSGTETCGSDGLYGVCVGEVLPGIEIPTNGIDEDCNGSDAECSPGATKSCYGGPDGTNGVGICQGGTATCGSDGHYGVCVGEVLPTSEIPANGIDEDCNGSDPECSPGATKACYGGPAGTEGVGICQSGTETCGSDGRYGTCSGEVFPAVEIPDNGIDEDCNGEDLTTIGDLPPDPVDVAPPLPTTESTSLADASSFLYTGSDPIQTGVAEDTIEFKRAAVLSGKVLDDADQPLPGVTATVLNHPELGQTLSRVDGKYDLAVNGGGVMTINFARDGYLRSQRTLPYVPWQDNLPVEDVVMVMQDSQVTTIDLASSPEPVQAARGSVVNDDAGARQATILIPQGITAQVYNVDGSTRPVTQLTLRLTEYTVGENGPKKMPAPLPPTSAYTYAVELAAEEASVKIAGKDVLFSQPVPFYVDNFLNMPIGIQVPVGYYDRDKAAWIPADDGRVIKILSVSAGLAELDTNGDGAVDNGALLGVTDAERQKLAQLYSPGQGLWRVPLSHLSTYDCNYGVVPQTGAVPPNQPAPNNLGSDDPCRADGSVIECQNQTLGEAIGIDGTPFSLNYMSDRVPGRNSDNMVSISMSGNTVPSSLKRIELEINVAGRTWKQTFPNLPNQRYTFEWDGKDLYGRKLEGSWPVLIRTGYVYDGFYALPSAMARSFGAASGQRIPGNIRARQDVILWQTQESSVGNNTIQIVGGWTLNIHHVYDPSEKVLYLGDGSQVSGELIFNSITTFAGSGVAGYSGDGGEATAARLSYPASVAVDPDSSVYVADSSNNRIRRVGSDGIITTIAGNGQAGYGGDGGQAITATLNNPTGVAVGSDGSIYIADNGNNRIRRVGSDGIITTIAGNGNTGYGGDGGQAIAAKLWGPTGATVASDGSIYIADYNNYRVRRVGPDGIIRTFAGTGVGGYEGDGGPATAAKIYMPFGVAVGPDGSVYVSEYNNHRIRRVGPDGIIRTFAGTGVGGYEGDGGSATAAKLFYPANIAPALDGSVYFSDSYSHHIRRVGPDGIITNIAGNGKGSGSNNGGNTGDGGLSTAASFNRPFGVAVDQSGFLVADYLNHSIRRVDSVLPGFSMGELAIPSKDGALLFAFNGSGRHLRTHDALTGAVLYNFGYDAGGNLISVTDASANTTTIEHDAFGKPVVIIAPFGQRTELTLDANGYLATVTNPAGETYAMTYTADGLLTRFQDPRGNASTMTYDELGRLTRDENAGGGGQNLSRIELLLGFEVSRTTGEGRLTKYREEELTTGDRRSTVILPDSTQSVRLAGTNGTTTTTSPDGTVITSVKGPDPRFGMQAPITTSLTTATGGLTRTMTDSRTAVLTDPANPFSMTQLTDTIMLNNRTSTQVYDAATRTKTLTSAAGRQATGILDSLGRVVQAQIAGITEVRFAYDTYGQLIVIAQGSGPDERVLALVYNLQGDLATVTDPANRIVQYEYDAAGRVIRKILPDNRETGFTYDANGNLTSLVTPAGTTHVFHYTPMDLPQEYSPPEIGAGTNHTLYEYNLDKDLTKITRPDNEILTFTYNSAGRLSSLSLPNGNLTYNYNVTTGKLSGITDPDNGALAFTYNGALLTKATSTGTVAGNVGLTYDNDFRVASISLNDANPVAYQYDADSLLTSAGDLVLFRSSQNGLLTGSILGMVTDSLTYNAFGEATGYEAKVNGTSLIKTDYTHDKLGRIISKVETVSGGVNTYDYTYDPAGRLTEVLLNGSVVSTYSYDENGNRLSHTQGGTTTTGTYDDQDRLLTYDGADYTYTANGELASKTKGAASTTYQYDVLGNLRLVTLPDGRTIDYVIDGANRRVGKKVNNTLVHGFLYQDDLKPIAELDGSGAIVSRFIYATHANVPDYLVKNGITYRIVTDHLGNPRYVVNTADGTIAQQIDYDEFGNIVYDSNPGFQPFGFAGGLYDQDTGLLRFGARDYDPVTGRWTAKDPILFVGGDTNLYGYVQNDPVNFVDPLGLKKFCVKPLFTNQAICWNVDDNNKIDDNPKTYEVENYPCIIDCWFEDKEFEEALERGENDNCI